MADPGKVRHLDGCWAFRTFALLQPGFLLKRLLLSLLRGFSKALSSSPRAFLLVKDEAVGSPAEHLYRLTALIRREVPSTEGMAIVDIGAAFGDTAHYFARQFPGTTIRAYEPFPESFEKAIW